MQSSYIHRKFIPYFEPKIANPSIRFLRSTLQPISITVDHFATSFQKYSVTPNAVHLADPLTPSHFTEAAGFVKRYAGNVFGEDTRLQRPNSIPLRVLYE